MHSHALPPAALDNAAEWLAHIADMLGAEASGLLTLRPDGGHHLIADGLDGRAIAEYRDYYHRFDPLPALLDARPAGRALVIDTATHPAYAAQREFCAGYLRPHGIAHLIAVQWRQADGKLRIAGVQRFRGSAPFSITQGKELDRIIHHWRVGNALPPRQGFAWNGGRGADCRRHCDIAAQLGLPLVVVDTHLSIAWASPAAREEHGPVWGALFDGGDKSPAASAIRHRLLETVLACLRQRAEAEALLTATEGAWLITAVPLQGKPRLTLLRVTAMHQLDQGIRGRLQRLFGLTPAEAETTALLAKGECLEAIAAARNVSPDTVRAQLRAVFRKTGIHRQAELACVVGRLAAG